MKRGVYLLVLITRRLFSGICAVNYGDLEVAEELLNTGSLLSQ
jgi:hypothetical protein